MKLFYLLVAIISFLVFLLPSHTTGAKIADCILMVSMVCGLWLFFTEPSPPPSKY